MSSAFNSSSPFASARPLVVVLADDTPDVLQRMRGWVEARGHRAITATSGNEAVRAIRAQPVDIVVTEIIMANGDGLEVMLELKNRQPLARVIAISAGGRYLPATDCLRVAKGLGAHEVLMKPVSETQLMAAIERLGAGMAAAAPLAHVSG